MTEWIFPSNKKNYDVNGVFDRHDIIEWYQTQNIKNVIVGDIVYIYSSTPDMKLTWKCRVVETHHVPTNGENIYLDQADDEPYVAIDAIQKLEFEPLLNYDRLKQHGLKSRLMGAQRVNPELSQYINSVCNASNIEDLQGKDAGNLPMEQLKKQAEENSKKPIKKSITNVETIRRDPYIAEYAKRTANGICQLCGQKAPFLDGKGDPYLESHHIIWLSQGGADSVENTVALCPNCHRRMHILKDNKDVRYLQSLKNKVKKSK